MAKVSFEQFLERAQKVHGDRCDYSKSKETYTGASRKVIIICKIHGEFSVVAYSHLKCNCSLCVGKSTNTENFIKKCQVVHNNRYDYSKTIYTHLDTLVTITCKSHGDFQTTPRNHLHGLRKARDKKGVSHGCKECGLIERENNKMKLFQGYGEIPLLLFNRIRAGHKRKDGRILDFSITIEFIWELFLKQNKKCALSGIDLIMMNSNNLSSGLHSASLDRIDSSKGYTEDNVQWIHKRINMMKSNLPEQDFFEWCQMITEYNKMKNER